jgi:hypothetical protein
MDNPQNKFSVRYERSEISYITQFLVSSSKEEVLVDLSPGLLENGSQPKTLPIQNRIAMPWSTVERLAAVLNQVVATRQQKMNKAPAPQFTNVPKATLPQMTQK